MVRLALFLAAMVIAGQAAANVADDMRVIGDAEKTRFVVDLEKSPDFYVQRLMNPYRLLINLADVEFADPGKLGEGRGLVTEYRYGMVAACRARIVLDLVGPVDIINTFVLDPSPAEPARFVIDLAPTTAPEYEAAVARDRPAYDAANPCPDQPQPAAPLVAGRPVVVIDPGHGGVDSGAIGKDGLLEKDLTLKFALELARQLKAGGKVEPVLTRDTDTSLALDQRGRVADARDAALFISIHADSVKQDYVRGATVYTLSEDASDALAAAAADRENRADILAGFSLDIKTEGYLEDILVDLTKLDTRNQSGRFAKTLVTRLDGSVALNSHPLRRGAFVVLKTLKIPSVLFELGYLSNKDDETRFHAPDWPQSEVKTTAKAIEDFFADSVAAGQ